MVGLLHYFFENVIVYVTIAMLGYGLQCEVVVLLSEFVVCALETCSVAKGICNDTAIDILGLRGCLAK